jgi:uncharacterized membrane protein YccF (DUF307 family)
MSFIGNVFWIVLGGFLITIEYLMGGIALCLSIIGIPFGIQLFKLAILSLFPFGKEIKTGPTSSGCLSTVFNIVWIVSGGILICVTHLVLAIILGITIIGIPFAKQHAKMATLALTPFGKTF